MLRKTSAVALAATVIGSWLSQTPASAQQPPTPTTFADTAPSTPAPRTATTPTVHPKPQSLRRQGDFARITPHVTLIADATADPYALDVIEQTLRTAGAHDVTRANPSDAGTSPAPGLTVYAGTSADSRLAALGAPPAGDLPDGGYRLAVSGDTVALQGAGADGLFHAAQTLRQLTTTHHQDTGFAPVTIRDWPAAPVRGIAESFYGVPWTQAQRLAQLDFMARTKQNRFLYAPGDDPYRQEQWREPYPAAQRADFRALAARAAADHVTLAWALAPGQNLCFSSATDEHALQRKLDAMWALGIRAFQFQFQDVSYSEWHCSADTRTFGTGARAAAKAQAQVTNAAAVYLAKRYGGAAELSLLPTEFYQDGATDYRTALAKALDPRVAVAWTGVGVVPERITGAQVAAANAALRHPLLTVDNYPVNDFAADRLFLGPYTGRQPAVATVSAGLLASAMQQPAASRIALFTAADFAWNPRGYDPQASWRAAIDDLAGPDGPTRAALRALAGNESSSALGGEESAYLRPLIAAFRAALPGGGQQLAAAGKQLRAAFTVMRTAPGHLDALAGGGFGDEVRPWLDRLSLYGAAGERAVDLLSAQARGDGAAAWRARQALDGDRTALADGTATVGGPVLDDFLTGALDDADAWAGLGADGRTATTSMASGRGTDPAAMVDGKDSTAWSSDAPPKPDDAFGVDLGTAKEVTSVRVAMGDGSGSDDFLHAAVLEVAADDGSGWRRIGEYHDRPVIEARLPAGTKIRRVRLRAVEGQPGAVTVREFAVAVSGAVTMSAAGPDRASAAVDGDLSTSAGSGPLTVDFGGARQLDTLSVAALDVASAAPAGRPPSGAPVPVEAHTAAGGWRQVGVLGGDWTELHVGALVDAVRLADGRGVCEVVPWFADAPRVTLDAPEVDVAAGGPAVKVTASVASGLPRDLAVATSVPAAQPGAAPVAVRAPAALPLRRGGTVRVPLTVSVPAGTAPGTYTVPVRFTVAGRTVERQVTVRAHLPTGGPDLVPGGTASSSGDETADFPAAAVADGDPATRWSSPVDDAAWVQVRLAAPARVGEVVLHWQDAYAARYEVQTSADGVTWHTAATVADGGGGREAVWLDGAGDTAYVRVQGVRRATAYGYSLYGIEAYAVTG
ncbi:beta-N-acetylglucosaminidase domain-containing protein [Streptomyces sp. NBC_01477]|uniref:beta-N-acetylglucosaminidase domain-containing protein n=1 Tax=Streptomyces sp. NBC_01477 TaxID=2976015 RepID=UPI002E36DC96|nr:beta-N-acetylglucosaminidase domain-containing protein [Streptomyces sp. NBC_01477]